MKHLGLSLLFLLTDQALLTKKERYVPKLIKLIKQTQLSSEDKDKMFLI